MMEIEASEYKFYEENMSVHRRGKLAIYLFGNDALSGLILDLFTSDAETRFGEHTSSNENQAFSLFYNMV